MKKRGWEWAQEASAALGGWEAVVGSKLGLLRASARFELLGPRQAGCLLSVLTQGFSPCRLFHSGVWSMLTGLLFFFLFIFKLKDNCFTEFFCFLSNINMNQP